MLRLLVVSSCSNEKIDYVSSFDALVSSFEE